MKIPYILPLFLTPRESTCALQFHDDHAYYYVKLDPCTDSLLVLKSKSLLSTDELTYLIININHIYLRPKSVPQKLADVLHNPFGFTNHNILIDKAKLDQQDTIIAIKDMDKLLEARGKALDDCLCKTEDLDLTSKGFLTAGENLNRCAC